MRLRGPVIACMLVGLGVSSERAGANGVVIVPVYVYETVAVTELVPLVPAHAGGGHRGLLGRLRHHAPAAAPVWVERTTYRTVAVLKKVVVPNPARPCYKPSTTPLGPTPSPQSIPAPSSQSGHDHASPSGQASATATADNKCGNCFPRCFNTTPCTCCDHCATTLPFGSAKAFNYGLAVQAGSTPYLFADDPKVIAAMQAGTLPCTVWQHTPPWDPVVHNLPAPPPAP